MKPTIHGLCIAMLMLLALNTSAQPASQKQFLFASYPSVINCTSGQLDKLFAAGKGETVNLLLPGNLQLQGVVTNKVVKYKTMETVSITLPSFKNILFSVTKRNDANNIPVYIGHLFNAAYADGYEIKKSAGNAYQFTKIETAKLLPTCNQ